MAFHLQEGLDLAERQVFSVPERDKLVEGAEQLVGILHNLSLVQGLAGARHDLGEEVKGIDVLQDVALSVGDEDHVEFVEGLINEANIVLLDGGVLGARVGELGERGQESFDSGPGHFSELSGEDSFPPAGADGGRKNNLEAREVLDHNWEADDALVPYHLESVASWNGDRRY